MIFEPVSKPAITSKFELVVSTPALACGASVRPEKNTQGYSTTKVICNFLQIPAYVPVEIIERSAIS
jgi:hypothetical protein